MGKACSTNGENTAYRILVGHPTFTTTFHVPISSTNDKHLQTPTSTHVAIFTVTLMRN
jgi:hypothetical protein